MNLTSSAYQLEQLFNATRAFNRTEGLTLMDNMTYATNKFNSEFRTFYTDTRDLLKDLRNIDWLKYILDAIDMAGAVDGITDSFLGLIEEYKEFVEVTRDFLFK